MSVKSNNVKKTKGPDDRAPGRVKIFTKKEIELYEEIAKKRGGQYGNGMFPPKGGK